MLKLARSFHADQPAPRLGAGKRDEVDFGAVDHTRANLTPSAEQGGDGAGVSIVLEHSDNDLVRRDSAKRGGLSGFPDGRVAAHQSESNVPAIHLEAGAASARQLASCQDCRLTAMGKLNAVMQPTTPSGLDTSVIKCLSRSEGITVPPILRDKPTA